MEKYTLIPKAAITALLVWMGTMPAQAQGSLYEDNKANGIGDIITVVLQENISGSTSSDAENRSNAAGGAGGSASGNFLPFQPTFGSDVEVNYNSDEQVSTNQGQLLEGYMSVEVIDKTDEGNLIVEGSRLTEINGELHKINLSGVIRPKDINGSNQVLSYRVANAKIYYENDGDVEGLMKKEGLLKRVALTGVGLVLGAVIVLKAVD